MLLSRGMFPTFHKQSHFRRLNTGQWRDGRCRIRSGRCLWGLSSRYRIRVCARSCMGNKRLPGEWVSPTVWFCGYAGSSWSWNYIAGAPGWCVPHYLNVEWTNALLRLKSPRESCQRYYPSPDCSWSGSDWSSYLLPLCLSPHANYLSQDNLALTQKNWLRCALRRWWTDGSSSSCDGASSHWLWFTIIANRTRRHSMLP